MLNCVHVNKNDNKMVPIETEKRLSTIFDVNNSSKICKFELFERVKGQRSPGCVANYSRTPTNNFIRRTGSLDDLRNGWIFGPVFYFNQSTQTDENFSERTKDWSSPTDLRIEKVVRQRLQRNHKESSSQTLSSIHSKGVLIPPRANHENRPMRSSVEGLNQEIEKLVLIPGLLHTCRPETSMFSRGTPDSNKIDGDMRDSRTPIGDSMSSDESTSPEDTVAGNSPRINRFLARAPPDGCEKINSKLTGTDKVTSTTLFKPCLGFQLRPSLGSAFKPLQPIPVLGGSTPEQINPSDESNVDTTT